VVNQCISAATSCLYGITEAAVLAAGYAPAIGFIHSGKPLSFVYDIADIIKFDTVVPKAFDIAARNPPCQTETFGWPAGIFSNHQIDRQTYSVH
jgi:CRISPR-associated protein Cas1